MIQKYGGKNGLNLRISSQNQHISPIPDFEVFFEILKKKRNVQANSTRY